MPPGDKREINCVYRCVEWPHINLTTMSEVQRYFATATKTTRQNLHGDTVQCLNDRLRQSVPEITGQENVHLLELQQLLLVSIPLMEFCWRNVLLGQHNIRKDRNGNLFKILCPNNQKYLIHNQ